MGYPKEFQERIDKLEKQFNRYQGKIHSLENEVFQKEVSDYKGKKYQDFLEDAVRNKANPSIEGEITREKLEKIGIEVIHEQVTGRKWVEQNGACISEVFDETEFLKNFIRNQKRER